MLACPNCSDTYWAAVLAPYPLPPQAPPDSTRGMWSHEHRRLVAHLLRTGNRLHTAAELQHTLGYATRPRAFRRLLDTLEAKGGIAQVQGGYRVTAAHCTTPVHLFDPRPSDQRAPLVPWEKATIAWMLRQGNVPTAGAAINAAGGRRRSSRTLLGHLVTRGVLTQVERDMFQVAEPWSQLPAEAFEGDDGPPAAWSRQETRPSRRRRPQGEQD